MNSILVATLLAIIGSSLACGQSLDERMAVMTAKFQEAYDREVGKPHEAAISNLDVKYATALERALQAASASGNLDESLRLQEEMSRLTAKAPLPSSDPETIPASLKSLRTAYRSTLADLERAKLQKTLPLLKALDAQLEALQIELTQGKLFNDAQIVKAKREDLRKQATAAAPVASGTNGALGNWLDLARRRGGRLKLWGGPAPGAEIEVPARAAKYDDYVSLEVCGVIQTSFCLKRRNGDYVIIDPANLDVHEPRNVAQFSKGEMDTLLGKNGTLFRPDGTEVFNSKAISKPAGFVHGYRGGIVFGADGEFEAFRMPENHAPPPSGFLKGHTITSGAAANALAFLTQEGKVLMWNAATKKKIALGRLDNLKVINLLSEGSSFIFLTDEGRVLACDDEGRFGNGTVPYLVDQALKTPDERFVLIRGTAAQRTDASWLGWNFNPKVNEKIVSIGAALDLDAAFGRRDQPDLGLLAWIEFPPGTVADSAPPATTEIP